MWIRVISTLECLVHFFVEIIVVRISINHGDFQRFSTWFWRRVCFKTCSMDSYDLSMSNFQVNLPIFHSKRIDHENPFEFGMFCLSWCQMMGDATPRKLQILGYFMKASLTFPGICVEIEGHWSCFSYLEAELGNINMIVWTSYSVNQKQGIQRIRRPCAYTDFFVILSTGSWNVGFVRFWAFLIFLRNNSLWQGHGPKIKTVVSSWRNGRFYYESEKCNLGLTYCQDVNIA